MGSQLKLRLGRYNSANLGLIGVNKLILIASSLLAMLVSMALIVATPQPTRAATAPDTCYTFDEATGTINSYSYDAACPKDLDISSQINGVIVTAIGDNAFNWYGLTSVTIPDTVTSIGNYAIYGNNTFTTVVIPDGVTSIGDWAFASNVNLTAVNIPEGVVTIGDSAFRDTALTSVTIPDSVTSIGTDAFSYSSLNSVVIGSGLSSISDYAFYDNKLSSVSIPSSITSIGNFAFAVNPLTTVRLEGTPTFGGYSFAHSYDSEARAAQEASCQSQHIGDQTAIDTCVASWIEANALITHLFAPTSHTYSHEVYQNLEGYIGGYVVNPAVVTINYTDSKGSLVQSSSTSLGGDVADQLLSSLLAINPDPTAADIADAYYIAGDVVTFNPPSIGSYQAPAPQTVTLTSGDNTVNFIYSAEGSDPASPDITVQAPNTGANPTTSIAALVMTSSVVVLLGLRMLRRNLSN